MEQYSSFSLLAAAQSDRLRLPQSFLTRKLHHLLAFNGVQKLFCRLEPVFRLYR